MSNIQALSDLYRKVGDSFQNDLLSSEVTVYQKLEGNHFGFVVLEHGVFDYFKKSHHTPIGNVDRILTSMYEEPIKYIGSLPPDVTEGLPDGYKFGFYYFPDDQPISIKYDKLPKNKLVLNYVEDENGNKLSNVATLDYYASILDVDPPPIYFKGKLSQEQKDKILVYLDTPESDDTKRRSYIATVLKILVPGVKSKYLKDDLKEEGDSLIFKFDDGKSIKYSKLQDQYFENVTSTKRREAKTSDNYYLILSDILDFMKVLNFKKIGLRTRKFEDRYLEFICKVFNKFIADRGKEYIGIDYDLPEYLVKEYAKININMIKDTVTKDYIDSTLNYQELFRIFLSSFRKKRFKQNSMFTSFMNKHFNDIVDEVMKKCSFGDDLSESYINFDDFKKIFIDGEDSRDVVGVDLDVWNQTHSQHVVGYREPGYDMSNFFKTVFVSTKNTSKRSKYKNAVNIMVDSFSPMLNTQLKLMRETYEDTGIPFYLFIVRDNKNAFQDSTMIKVMDSLATEECIVDYAITDRPILSTFVSVTNAEYRINKMYCTEYYKMLLDVQVKSNTLNNNLFNLISPNETIIEYDKDDSIMIKVDDALNANQYQEFKKYVPQQYINLFSEIISNIEYNKQEIINKQ